MTQENGASHDAARKTKIVVTVGPASRDEATIEGLVQAGTDLFRLNFSHGTHAEHERTLAVIRAVAERQGRPVGVLQDLCGPKIRVTELVHDAVDLVAGSQVTIVGGLATSTAPDVIGCTYAGLAGDAKPGERILLNDGLIELRVEEVEPAKGEVRCRVVYGGSLKKGKGVNLPDTSLSVPSVTDKDREDLRFGLEHEVDWVACSFVRSERDVEGVRETIRAAGKEIGVIAKIEKPEAIDRLEAIVEAADGVMVARGDLGVELPLHEVPALQKRIIREAVLRDRPVITATQMLESMTSLPRPTRAEVSDVANAIFDGTDAVMLSGETAVGRDPVRVVTTMARIARAADHVAAPVLESRIDRGGFADALCDGAQRIARHLEASALVVFTASGTTALFMSKYDAPMPVFGVTDERRPYRRMSLYRGITPLLIERTRDAVEAEDALEQRLLERGVVRQGDVLVLVGGADLAARGNDTSLKIRTVGERRGATERSTRMMGRR